MRRKKDDKRVLIPRNNRPPAHKRQRKLKNRQNKSRSRQNRRYSQNNNYNRQRRKKRKSSGITMVLVIVALLAFVIGAGFGISLSFDKDKSADDGPHYQNVTDEMTGNVTDPQPVTYDDEVDGVDFNDNQTASDSNASSGPSY